MNNISINIKDGTLHIFNGEEDITKDVQEFTIHGAKGEVITFTLKVYPKSIDIEAFTRVKIVQEEK